MRRKTNKSNTSTKRAQLRKRLLDNGYTPLPLKDKGVRIKGWSTATIDADWLAQYDRVATFPNTGLRCDKLIAFDLDVLDADLCDEIDDLICDEIGSRTDLVRFGADPKKLLLYRLKGEEGRSARTGMYDEHRVELLCGSGRQFAAYGTHPSGVEYEWQIFEPLNTQIEDLPVCTHEQALQALDKCEAYFIEQGLKLVKHPYSRELHDQDEVFDLTDDFPIQLEDGTELTWSELKPMLDEQGIFGNIKREDGEFGDSDGIHFMIAQGSKDPCAFDFVRDVLHWEATFEPDKLAAALPGQPATGDESPDPSMFTPDKYRELLEEWVIVTAGATVRRISDPLRGYSFSEFKQANTHLTMVQQTAKRPKNISLVQAWMTNPKALRADYAALLPMSTEALVEHKGATVFNTYRPPQHPVEGGEIETVVEFIEHLIPKEDERILFWDWHAHKLVHPEARMHGLMMVTPQFGTGRGTWLQILQKLFGSRYVKEIPLTDLVGTSGQASYNEYLAESLIVAVPEALEEKDDTSTWRSRRIAYERLKMVVEPQATEKWVKRKYGRNTVEAIYASILIQTNHADALAIEGDDRRLIVLENTTTSLEDQNDLRERIHAWMNKPANIGALVRALQAHHKHSTYDPYGKPMWTDSKEKMISLGDSDISKAHDYVVENAPGDIMTLRQYEHFMNQARTEWDLEWPQNEKIDAVIRQQFHAKCWRIKTLPKSGQMKVDKQAIRPWILRNRHKWESHTHNAQIRTEILKNGDPRGPSLQSLQTDQ